MTQNLALPKMRAVVALLSFRIFVWFTKSFIFQKLFPICLGSYSKTLPRMRKRQQSFCSFLPVFTNKFCNERMCAKKITCSNIASLCFLSDGLSLFSKPATNWTTQHHTDRHRLCVYDIPVFWSPPLVLEFNRLIDQTVESWIRGDPVTFILSSVTFFFQFCSFVLYSREACSPGFRKQTCPKFASLFSTKNWSFWSFDNSLLFRQVSVFWVQGRKEVTQIPKHEMFLQSSI